MWMELDRDRFLQYDFGGEITGAVFTDARRTVPADLSGFDSAEFRYFKEGAAHRRFDTQITGNRFTARIPQNSFLRTGIFLCNLNFKASGRSVSTFNEEITIVENAV